MSLIALCNFSSQRFAFFPEQVLSELRALDYRNFYRGGKGPLMPHL
jgi:hypothetical protein